MSVKSVQVKKNKNKRKTYESRNDYLIELGLADLDLIAMVQPKNAFTAAITKEAAIDQPALRILASNQAEQMGESVCTRLSSASAVFPSNLLLRLLSFWMQ